MDFSALVRLAKVALRAVGRVLIYLLWKKLRQNQPRQQRHDP